MRNEKDIGYEIEVVKGDITIMDVDAIVNAAHEELSGGGGVDGAIHQAAGPKLLGECLNLYGCPIGEARITGGYYIPARYVIHTVGPVWNNPKDEKKQRELREQLMECYTNCLKFAEMQGLKTIAFPCISTGAFCFPKERAAKIAISSMQFWLGIRSYIDKVYVVCFDEENYNIYQELLESGYQDTAEDLRSR